MSKAKGRVDVAHREIEESLEWIRKRDEYLNIEKRQDGRK